MRIYVCLKSVPDTAAVIRVTGADQYDESVKYVINPYDEYALEEAAQLKEREGGEVIAVTVGKTHAEKTLRSALAVGADRAIMIETDSAFLPPDAIAEALSAAIIMDGEPDMVFVGRQSADSESMQTHYLMANKLGLPFVNDVSSFAFAGGVIRAVRETGGGTKEVYEMKAPAMIGAARGLNMPRYPKLPDNMKAKKKRLDKTTPAALNVSAGDSGTVLSELLPVPERGKAEMITGTPDEMAATLIDRLKNKSGVL